MSKRIAACAVFLLTSAALAQTDRGTITGTISDPVGAVVPNATVEAFLTPPSTSATVTPLSPATKSAVTGSYTSGYGYVNEVAGTPTFAAQPQSGQIVARFTL